MKLALPQIAICTAFLLTGAVLAWAQGDAKDLYLSKCATCHGADGAGKPPILPALWGPDSYNDGAGMNQVPKMAAFVQHNMPQNHPGVLTAQEAYDVSTFVAAKPHSPFDAAFKNY